MELEKEIKNLGIRVYHIPFSGKKDYIKAWFKCYRLLRSTGPDIVHCHLFDANIIGLSAAKAAGIKKRIHTRHHGDLHHVSFPRGVWLDRLVNSLSTDVVAPSEVAKKVLVEMDKIEPSKVKVIHHGFDFREFQNIAPDRVLNLRMKYNIPECVGPVVGIIARWTEWKGVHIAIKTFFEFRKNYSNALLILANAHGDYEKSISELLNQLPDESYRVIRFEKDIAALYRLFDIYIHVPIRETAEAFGQTYIESLALGLKCIFTKSGVLLEFLDTNGFYKVRYEDVTDLYEKLVIVDKAENNSNNFDLRNFELDKYLKKLQELYIKC